MRLRSHILFVLASMFAPAQVLVTPNPVQAEGVVSVVSKTTNPATQARYKNPELNFEFNYPRAFVSGTDPDPNVVVKLSGVLDNRHAELKVSKLSGPQDLRSSEQAIEGFVHNLFPGSTLSGRRSIRFGKSFQLNGSESLFSLRIGADLYAYRSVVFTDSKQTYIFGFLTLAENDSTLKPIFEQVLSSVEQQSAGAGTHTLVKAQTWTFEKFSDNDEKVAFDIPKGWKIERGAPGTHEIKFRGTDPSNNSGELFFVSLDRAPATSLEAYKAAAQSGWKTCKDYKQTASTHSTFGLNRHEGDIDLYTFSVANVQFHQISANFFDEHRFYIIGINGALWSEREVRTVFDRVLATLKLGD